MRKLFSTKKRIATVVGVTVLAVGISGGAFAYFTSGGTGTGQGSVGAAGASDWGVAAGTAVGAMYPGSGTSVITFTLTNNGTGTRGIDDSSELAAAIVNDGAGTPNIEQSGTPLLGCEAAWFGVVSVGAPSVGYGTSVAHGGTTTVAVTIHMLDAATDQDVCQSATPDVSLTVSS